MSVLYVRTDGSDSNDGSADTRADAKLTIASAVSAAANGDTIIAVDGPFPEATPLNLGAKSLTLIGQKSSGYVEVPFTFEGTTATFGSLLNGGFCENIYAHGTIDNATDETGLYQMPAGVQNKAPSSQALWSSASYTGCKLKSDSDALWLSSAAGAGTCNVTVRDTVLESKFDTHNQLSQIPTTPWNGLLVEYFDCTWTVAGPTPDGFNSHLYRGIAVGCGKVRCYGGTVDVTGNDSSGQALVWGIAIVNSAAAKPRFEGIGLTVVTHDGDEEASLKFSNSGGKVCLTNCTIDAAKFLGTPAPSIVTVSGGVRRMHQRGGTYSLTYTNGNNTTFDQLRVNGVDVGATFGGGTVTWNIPEDFAVGDNATVDLYDTAASEGARIDLIRIATRNLRLGRTTIPDGMLETVLPEAIRENDEELIISL
jgi:hypothetical protein